MVELGEELKQVAARLDGEGGAAEQGPVMLLAWVAAHSPDRG